MYRPTLAAAILCRDPEFHQFLASQHADAWSALDALPAPDRAASIIRETCRIQSRKELDSNAEAKFRYDRLIGFPYSAWRSRR